MRSGNAEFVPFDPNAKQPKMSYKVTVFCVHSNFVRLSDTAVCVEDFVSEVPCSYSAHLFQAS